MEDQIQTYPLNKPEIKNKIEYTCPMHPQIHQTESGKCPICGMFLEPIKIQNDKK